MRANVGLIGKGKWGNLIKSKLEKISNLKFISGKKKDYFSLIKNENLNWIFIATPNDTHYRIVKNCLNLGINVFCEKPLTTSFTKTKQLINISKKKKVKLYISDIYSFHNLKIRRIFLKNRVFRSKRILGRDNEFIFRFMYHDISILYNHIKKLKIETINISKFPKKITKVAIKFKNCRFFLFEYCLSSNKKRHLINNKNFISKKDFLKKMLISVINGKVNIKSNHNKALFISEFLDIIKSRI